MAYRTASKLTLTPAWADMNEDQRLAEQSAALDTVAKYGGHIEAQWVLWSDQVFLSIITYPDQESAVKAQMAVVARGAFALQSQSAFTLEEVQGWQAEATSS